MPRPSARSSVPDSSRRTAAHSSSGRIARDQALAWSSPVGRLRAAVSGSMSASDGRWCTSSITSSVRWRRNSRRCRSGAAAMPDRSRYSRPGRGSGSAYCPPHAATGRGRARRARPGRRKPPRLAGAESRAAPPSRPARQPGCDQPRGGDHRQQRLAAARRDGGEDIAGLRPAGNNGLDHAGQLLLMGAQRTRGRNTHRNCRTAMSSRNVEPQCRPLAGSRTPPIWLSRRDEYESGTALSNPRADRRQRKCERARKQRANNHRQSFFATIQALAGERSSIRVPGGARALHRTRPADRTAYGLDLGIAAWRVKLSVLVNYLSIPSCLTSDRDSIVR